MRQKRFLIKKKLGYYFDNCVCLKLTTKLMYKFSVHLDNVCLPPSTIWLLIQFVQANRSSDLQFGVSLDPTS